MPSPFPGMNPYLENPTAWTDFHNLFIARMATEINRLAPQNYFAKVEDQLYVHELPQEQWRPIARADVGVELENGPTDLSRQTAVLAEPTTVELIDPIELVNLPYITIHGRDRDQVITVIELLSPSNKYPGGDRDQFANKRLRLSTANTNYVEVDLLRGGKRHDFGCQVPECMYYVLVSRPRSRPTAGFWPIGLKDPLPAIRIPLLSNDIEPTVDLQLLLHEVYDSGRFEMFIYRDPPSPPLSKRDAAWATRLVPPERAKK